MITGAATKLIVATLITVSSTSWAVSGGDFKCYEDYRCITSTSSPQYQLQLDCWTDDNGLRRYHSYYCIALGSAYGSHIGDKYLITLSTGQEFVAVLADQKADRDTVDGHTRDRSGAIIEFLVETEALPYEVRQSGSVSSIPGFNGEVREIRRLKDNDGM